MSYEIRAITADEYPAFRRLDSLGFNDSPPEPEDVERTRAFFEVERSRAVFDDGRMVATSGNYSFMLSVPGGQELAAAGVSWVSVHPDYRRQGLLRAMMGELMDDAEGRGESLAILTASESSIYGRFGFGVASYDESAEIARHAARLAVQPSPDGAARMVDPERASAVIPALYDRLRPVRPGAVTRSRAWWDLWFSDPKDWRDGLTARLYILYEERGEALGYAAYRFKRHWEAGLPQHQLHLMELQAATPSARAALWQTLLRMDLVAGVAIPRCPVDEPLRQMLAEPRQLRVTRHADDLWVRILDVPRALEGRRYGAEDRLALEIRDDYRGAGGRYLLECGPDGARCRRTDAEPDLAMGIADLGAIYLGGVSPASLALAGRVDERRPGALRRATAIFAGEIAPWLTSPF